MLHQCFSILVLLLCSNRLIFRMSWLQREAPCWSPQIMVLPGCSAIAGSAPRAPNYNPAASTPCVRDPEGLCGDKIRHERGLLCGKPGRFSTTFVRGTRSYFAKWGHTTACTSYARMYQYEGRPEPASGHIDNGPSTIKGDDILPYLLMDLHRMQRSSERTPLVAT